MKRPLRTTIIVLGVVLTLGALARVGFKIAVEVVGLTLASACFAAGLNARAAASAPTRLLDGAAAVVGGHAVVSVALGQWANLPVSVAAFALALASSSWLQLHRGGSGT